MMESVHPIQAYIDLANGLFHARIRERDLAAVTSRLPDLDEPLLREVGQRAEEFAVSAPRFGWALCRVAYGAAIAQKQSPFIRSLAAWYLGRASNHWAQPKKVKAALSRARRGFVKLKESGWVAACDWQLNALAWTQPDLAMVVKALSEALKQLEDAGFDDFVPECRLALAYAQILTKDYDGAKKNIQLSENAFLYKGDTLNQARCWLHQASYLRREDHFDQALDKLQQAGMVFETLNAPLDRAKAYYQEGLCYLLRTDNLLEATERLRKAIDLFSACDLELWRAMCIMNLGSVYLFTGELAHADGYYEEARKVFVHHRVTGLLADNLQDCGEVNILRGRPDVSIGQFKQAASLHEKLGVRLPAAISITNLGKAYGQMGRYQDALFYLEQAAERLQSLDSPLRLGTCEKYIALIWLQLGQPALAHQYLDQATSHYELAQQNALLPEMYNYRAEAYFQQGREANALEWLQKSLELATRYQMRPQANQARRLLGEGLIRLGRYEEALERLQQAQEESATMGMLMDQAASFLACGEYYELTSEATRAQSYFEQALQLSQGAWPEIEWKAYIGLGDLAASRADTQEVLRAYQKGAERFTEIRQNFWQPNLVGSYLQRSSQTFDKVIAFASQTGFAQETLFLIEQSKASTLLRQLLVRDVSDWNTESQEMSDLQAEIDLLQDRLRNLREESLPIQTSAEFQQLQRTLREKIRQYSDLKSRLERQRISEQASTAGISHRFDLEVFRNRANAVLQKNWLALDYYLINNQLITILIGSEICEVLSSTLPHRAVMALDAYEKARRNPAYSNPDDLRILGKILIPEQLNEYLTPETYLHIAPHRKLHSVPWPALFTDFRAKALVCSCIPVVVPSLQSLTLLWQRNRSRHTSTEESGLVVGVSQFHGRHDDLPHVKDEIHSLRSALRSKGKYLTEEEATWENLLKHSQKPKEEGLSRFAWLHVASHFFNDGLTGRLSGLALWDRDVWLDQLRDLGHFPGLVTVSACNSSSSFVYEGDEHVDLPTTCMVAGADTVVGSIWPVVDQAAAELISAFYRHHLTGLRPAQALAQAQREFANLGRREDHWYSFVCIGVP